MEITQLPNDCLSNIFEFLPIRNKIYIEGVCKSWRSILLRTISYSETKSVNIAEIIPSSPIPNQETYESAIDQILQRCGHHLRTLSFGSRWDRITQNVVGSIERRCGRITHLDLSASIIDADLSTLLSKLSPKIQYLSLEDSSWSNVEEAVKIDKVMNEFREIRYLNLRGFTFSLSTLHRLPKKLKSIDLSCTQTISTNSLIEFLSTHTQLNQFWFNSVVPISGEVIRAIGNLVELETLSFGCGSNSNQSLLPYECLCNLLKLKSFNISYCNSIDSRCIEQMSRSLKNLNSLTIEKCPKIYDYSCLANFPKLQTLEITESNHITDADLICIAGKKSLQHLSVVRCPNITSTSIKAIIRECPLVELNLEQCENISDETLATLAASSRAIKSISLKGCSSITSNGVKYIALMENVDKIQELDLSDNRNVDDTAVIRIYASLSLKMDQKSPRNTNISIMKVDVSRTGISNNIQYDVSDLIDLIC